MANIKKGIPELKITIGAEYNFQNNTVQVGKTVDTLNNPRQKKNNKEYTDTIVQATGVILSLEKAIEDAGPYETPMSLPEIKVVENTTPVGSGTHPIDVSGTGTICDDTIYGSGYLPGYGYTFFENLESTSGNLIHWGVYAKGVNSIVDGIEYPDTALVGLLHPGDRSGFRLSPSGVKIRFISASGISALADGTISNRKARLKYTLFPQ